MSNKPRYVIAWYDVGVSEPTYHLASVNGRVGWVQPDGLDPIGHSNVTPLEFSSLGSLLAFVNDMASTAIFKSTIDRYAILLVDTQPVVKKTYTLLLGG